MDRAFRTLKSRIHLRPRLHGTAARVRGPVTVCAPALVWEDTLQRWFRDAGVLASTRTVLADLERAPAVPLSVNDQAYLGRTPWWGSRRKRSG
jgi:hypothetical protein